MGWFEAGIFPLVLGLIDPSLAWSIALVGLHSAITLAVVVRVIMSNRSVGATLAWIAVLMLFPVLGPGIYLMIGELRLGARRARLVQRLAPVARRRFEVLERDEWKIDWTSIGKDGQMLAKAGQNMLQVPAVPGNRFELVDSWEEVFERMIEDIDLARVNCDLEFYIWDDAGRAGEVAKALERAVERGVICRVLLDAIGSRDFLRSATARRLMAKGIRIQSALPGGLWRLPFVRFDLRLHRKIVLIDDEIAWTGSLNLVDPRYFKQNSGVGQWVDAMVRIEGPAVEALAITFQADWYVETNSSSPELPDVTGDQLIQPLGTTTIQVLPSGPANYVDAIERLLITAIYSARSELVITTPYFVPSEALQMALVSASLRGVDVTIVLPARVDSVLVRWASRALLDELMQARVTIARFQGGLLHTKSVTIDGNTSLFGSLNMDPRSFRLNFEITLAVFDGRFTSCLRAIQQRYLEQSRPIDATHWRRRSFGTRFIEKAARLLGPLL
jgi:cardiolipin synthase